MASSFDKCIVVRKDWGSSALWGRGRFGGLANFTSYDELSLPQWLVDRMNYWSDWFDCRDPEQPDHHMDWEDFHAYGLSIAIDLKRFLGAEWEVEYDAGYKTVHAVTPPAETPDPDEPHPPK